MLERVRELTEAEWRIWRERQIQRHRDGLKDARGDLDLSLPELRLRRSERRAMKRAQG